MTDIIPFVDLLDAAERAAVAVTPFARRRGLTLDDAYTIQEELFARRLARGDVATGLKLGFTSEAMRKQMGVDRPNIGWLSQEMEVGAQLPTTRFIQPRLEPEVAARLAEDIETPLDGEALRRRLDGVAPAIEIVDSRFVDYRFDWLDNVADNSSSAGYVVGPWRDASLDLASLRVRLLIDGESVDAGEGAAAMGDPLAALAEGVRIALSRGRRMRAGMIVLTGGLTRAHPIRAGQIAVADFGDFGAARLTAV